MKAMKVLIVPIVCLISTACSVEISEMDKRRAGYICKDMGGVYVITSASGAQCNTGKWFTWKQLNNTVMTPEYVMQLEKTK